MCIGNGFQTKTIETCQNENLLKLSIEFVSVAPTKIIFVVVVTSVDTKRTIFESGHYFNSLHGGIFISGMLLKAEQHVHLEKINIVTRPGYGYLSER